MLSIAPMIDWSYGHFRVLMRYLAPNALVYTEMQTTGAIQNNPSRSLCYTPVEHPIAIQLGGSDKNALVECAKMAEQIGYDEINLNLGCPSDKVQAGQFGACLMKEPDRVVDCISAIKNAVNIPVTAKTRIGIDHEDSYLFFSAFASRLIAAGVDKLIVHARKAWLNGLNPKQNRTIPPLHYDYVYQIKKQFPQMPVVINGNILNISDINHHLNYVDGVMLGRLACDNPYKIAEIHHALYPDGRLLKRSEIYIQYLDYLKEHYNTGTSLSLLIKPIFNLAYGLPGSTQWKKELMNRLQSKNVSHLSELIPFLVDIEMRNKDIISV